MAQKAVELILARQLAGHLAMPMLLFDPQGNLLFCNPSAEALVGGTSAAHDGAGRPRQFALRQVTHEDGTPLANEECPLSRALQTRQAAHAVLWLPGADGIRRRLEATAIPLAGPAGDGLGAVVALWEAAPP